MRIVVFLIWFSAIPLLGQTPVASPASERAGSAPFGSSLKKYENKDWRKEADDNETIRVETALVVNDVLVNAPDGSPITTLKKEDLTVKDDGEQQEIELFLSEASKPIPRSIVLIMGILNPSDWSNYERKVRAAKLIVDDLGQNDEMAIVTNDLRLLTDFTNDKIRLKDSLDVIAQRTDWLSFTVFGTLMATLNEKFKEKNGRRPIVIVQGAISEIFTIKTDYDSFWNSSPFAQQFVKRYLEFADVESAVKQSKASFYNVITTPQILGRPRKEQLKAIQPLIRESSLFLYDRYFKVRLTQPPFIPGVHNVSRERHVEMMQKRPDKVILGISEHQRAMTRLADISGGASYFVEKPEDADAAYKKLSQTIRSRYTIGYQPKTPGTPGKPRSIAITVKDHPEYTVTTRKIYIP